MTHPDGEHQGFLPLRAPENVDAQLDAILGADGD